MGMIKPKSLYRKTFLISSFEYKISDYKLKKKKYSIQLWKNIPPLSRKFKILFSMFYPKLLIRVIYGIKNLENLQKYYDTDPYAILDNLELSSFYEADFNYLITHALVSMKRNYSNSGFDRSFSLLKRSFLNPILIGKYSEISRYLRTIDNYNYFRSNLDFIFVYLLYLFKIYLRFENRLALDQSMIELVKRLFTSIYSDLLTNTIVLKQDNQIKNKPIDAYLSRIISLSENYYFMNLKNLDTLSTLNQYKIGSIDTNREYLKNYLFESFFEWNYNQSKFPMLFRFLIIFSNYEHKLIIKDLSKLLKKLENKVISLGDPNCLTNVKEVVKLRSKNEFLSKVTQIKHEPNKNFIADYLNNFYKFGHRFILNRYAIALTDASDISHHGKGYTKEDLIANVLDELIQNKCCNDYPTQTKNLIKISYLFGSSEFTHTDINLFFDDYENGINQVQSFNCKFKESCIGAQTFSALIMFKKSFLQRSNFNKMFNNKSVQFKNDCDFKRTRKIYNLRKTLKPIHIKKKNDLYS